MGKKAVRSYESLSGTQQRERRKRLRQAADYIGCPISAVASLPHTASTTTPADLLHLPTSIREQIRTVRGLHIPSEKRMIQCKKALADTHGTRTGTFSRGAYILDPIRFVTAVAGASALLVVGGDAGGGHTKLGITYTVLDGCTRLQTFAALLVYEGKDGWEELSRLESPGLTPFEGDSAEFPHIFAVLQHLIDKRDAFLNGDWPFINTLLGYKNASAIHPCPICIVSHGQLLRTARYRTAADQHSRNLQQHALITIIPQRIVPTPLHVFLGISNRIILEAFSELLGEESVRSVLSDIKTVHTAGCGGLSDLFDLNGQEISKWLKHDCSTKLIAAHAASAGASAAGSASAGSVSDAKKASLSILSQWLQQLHDCLMRKTVWDADDIEAWRGVVSDIHSHWQVEAHSNPFPKLHMLHHTVEFAERYRFLGRASEAQIESFHRSFNSLFHRHHHNLSRNIEERLRRSLADSALRAVQLFAPKQVAPPPWPPQTNNKGPPTCPDRNRTRDQKVRSPSLYQLGHPVGHEVFPSKLSHILLLHTQ